MTVRMNSLKRMAPCAFAMLLATTLLATTLPAAAMPGCDGVYSATALQPLPTPLVVRPDIRNQSAGNVRLADRFASGLRSAGVAVGGAANVSIYVATSTMGGASSSSVGGGQSDYEDFGALDGGVQLALPETGRMGRTRALSPVVLFLRVEVSPIGAARPTWVASLQCTVTGSDRGQLAQDIGHLVGSTMGQRIDRRRL